MAEKDLKTYVSQPYIGLNLNSTAQQIGQGELSWAINAILENFDGNNVTYQNEQGNIFCVKPPEGFRIIGNRHIIEKDIIVLWLVNPDTEESEIGVVQDCIYTKKINAACLALDINYPILKTAVKVTNCTTEVYWTDGKNGRRFIDLDNLPYREVAGCPPTTSSEIDCNKLSVQTNFFIPELSIESVQSNGSLEAGTYQFAIQYSNVLGEGYTSYYSVTNPLSVFDITKITLDFNYTVGKSINVSIDNLDTTGYYDYFNLAVIKTVNDISTPYLVGTYQITTDTKTISYTGQSIGNLSMQDIFERFPIYDTAQDLTVVQDILIWDQLTTEERISYQSIANQITLQWQTYRLNGDKPYRNEINTATRKGYMRDEVYPWEVVFLLINGKQTDGFHIPGRLPSAYDLEAIANNDVIGENEDKCNDEAEALPRWKVYNTASVSDTTEIPDECYEGEYQYGEFGYYESTETYPCNDIYGDLSGKQIRLPRFPDSLISHIHDNQGFIYPIGVKINVNQIKELINSSSLTPLQKSKIAGFKIVRGNRATNKSIIAKGIVTNIGQYERDNQTYFFPNFSYNDLRENSFISDSPTGNDTGSNQEKRLRAFDTDDSRKRYALHSPDTSFFQPNLGNILKLETAEHGLSRGHFVEVKEHAKYKFLTTGAYALALATAIALAAAGSGVDGLSTESGVASYQLFVDIIYRLSPRKNFAYQHTSVGNYTDFIPVPNDGNKQRFVDIANYLSPGMVSVGDIHIINNFQRESSLYLRTTETLPYPHEVPGVPEDTSRWILSDLGTCETYRDMIEMPISAFYTSLKRFVPNQYGQLYSYETIDTGFQIMLDEISGDNPYRTVFGGDIFINRFGYKSKVPFFIDNRIGSNKFANDADVEYNELSNIGYATFWFSTGYTDDGGGGGLFNFFKQLLGVQVNNFDCENNTLLYQRGKIYLFSYGIPYFYCESEVNVDMRQAFNNKEGDFYPRVGEEIPDEWLQEVNTTIQQDNTYHYNRTYSKQNKENVFTHLPDNFTEEDCRKSLPFRGIFSERQEDLVDYRRNNWLIYRPVSKVDFPQNYGKLISLEGIENKQVLARFESKSLLYNALLTAPTSAQDVYLGQSLFSQQVPPLDFAETDNGYAGTQHKMFIKTEYGHVSTDSKRGQIFLFQGRQTKDITGVEQKVSKFFGEFLDFQISRYFPEINVDNHFSGLGLHGVYDGANSRLILTKLDYRPIDGVTYEDGSFFFEGDKVLLGDPDYFCNYSFTASYNFEAGRWISFHTYIPDFYINAPTFFYSGINGQESTIWEHGTNTERFNNFYGQIHPYTLEYPFAFKNDDEILHSIKDYTKVLQYTDFGTFIETDDYYYNECVVFNNQQSSGILKPKKKPANNLSEYGKYPKYNTDSKEVTFTKNNNFYNINTFWGLTKSAKQPIWKRSCENLSIYKELNQDNCDYSKRSFKKAPIMAKDLKIRFTLNDRDNIKMITNFIFVETQNAPK